MIGNDVVDLHLASVESNWRRKGFLERVFHLHEQDLIYSSPVPDNMIWLLWSMKEAAYKAHQRAQNLPRKLDWQQQESFLHLYSGKTATGRVKIGDKIYITSSKISESYIHTEALKEEEMQTKSEILEAPGMVSKMRFLKVISEVFQIRLDEISLDKDVHGKPYVTYKKGYLFSDFSFSGHGRFSAYTAALTNCEMPVKHY